MSRREKLLTGIILTIITLQIVTFGIKQGCETIVEQPFDIAIFLQPDSLASREQTVAKVLSKIVDSSLAMRYARLARKYSTENVPMELIAAVIIRESYGDSMAIGKRVTVRLSSGLYRQDKAIGLMQILPVFWKNKMTHCPGHNLFEPEVNICYGARILEIFIELEPDIRTALRRYSGDAVDYDDLVLEQVGHIFLRDVISIY